MVPLHVTAPAAMSNRMHILTPRPRLYPRPAPRRHLQPARLQRHYNSYAQQHRQQSELKRFSTASQDQEIIQQDVTQISPAQPQGDVAAAASSGLDALPRHKKAQKFESGAAVRPSASLYICVHALMRACTVARSLQLPVASFQQFQI